MATFVADGSGQEKRIYPIGTEINGWRLLITRKPHKCAECGRAIRKSEAAWFRPWPIEPAQEYIGQACCQWRVVES